MSENRALRVVVLVACVSAFLALGIAVKLNAVAAVDHAAAAWFERQVTGSRTAAAFVVTQLGSDPVTIAIAVVVSLRIRRRFPYWLKRLLITVGGGMVSNEVLKFIFYRHRPELVHPLLHLYSNSFPSGHTLAATVLFGTLIILTRSVAQSTWLRTVILPFGIVMIALIGASRIYLGVHYFSDVVGGVLEGIVWIAGVGMILDRNAKATT